MQRIRHDPENGQYGDCHRAALASVLEMDYNEVPHFCGAAAYAEGGESWVYRERTWLVGHGYAPIHVPFTGDLESILEHMSVCNPSIYYILGGMSSMGTGHSVVCCGNEIVHDPSPMKTSIVGPLKDGHYWVTMFSAARTSRYGEQAMSHNKKETAMTPYRVAKELLPTPHQAELLVIAAEECSEVAQRASKILRFGAKEVQLGAMANNADRFMMEWYQLQLMVDMLIAAGVLTFNQNVRDMVRNKKAQNLIHYMQNDAPPANV